MALDRPKPMRDVVVIGGSLAGMKALCQLIDKLPRSFSAPILAVLHSAPESEGSVAQMLGNCTEIPVLLGADGMTVEPGKVYLAPTGGHLVLRSTGLLGLDAGPQVHHSRPAADRLFETAAKVYGPRVIGVVLSGGSGDGTDGLRVINAAGGIGVVQETDEPFEANVARGAEPAGPAHYCLPLDDIADLLRKLIDGDDLETL